jgi:hypothetical protein
MHTTSLSFWKQKWKHTWNNTNRQKENRALLEKQGYPSSHWLLMRRFKSRCHGSELVKRKKNSPKLSGWLKGLPETTNSPGKYHHPQRQTASSTGLDNVKTINIQEATMNTIEIVRWTASVFPNKDGKWPESPRYKESHRHCSLMDDWLKYGLTPSIKKSVNKRIAPSTILRWIWRCDDDPGIIC